MSAIKVNALEIVNDIRSGMNDPALMEKYKVSPQGLEKLFRKLVAAGYLTEFEIDQRSAFFEDVVQIPPEDVIEITDEEPDEVELASSGLTENKERRGSAEPSIQRSEQTQVSKNVPPAQIFQPDKSKSAGKMKWECPSCHTPQQFTCIVCPKCGLIVGDSEEEQRKLSQQNTVRGFSTNKKLVFAICCILALAISWKIYSVISERSAKQATDQVIRKFQTKERAKQEQDATKEHNDVYPLPNRQEIFIKEPQFAVVLEDDIKLIQNIMKLQNIAMLEELYVQGRLVRILPQMARWIGDGNLPRGWSLCEVEVNGSKRHVFLMEFQFRIQR